MKTTVFGGTLVCLIAVFGVQLEKKSIEGLKFTKTRNIVGTVENSTLPDSIKMNWTIVVQGVAGKKDDTGSISVKEKVSRTTIGVKQGDLIIVDFDSSDPQSAKGAGMEDLVKAMSELIEKEYTVVSNSSGEVKSVDLVSNDPIVNVWYSQYANRIRESGYNFPYFNFPKSVVEGDEWVLDRKLVLTNDCEATITAKYEGTVTENGKTYDKISLVGAKGQCSPLYRVAHLKGSVLFDRSTGQIVEHKIDAALEDMKSGNVVKYEEVTKVVVE